MSKAKQYDYAVLNQAVYSNDPQAVLKKYNRDKTYYILEEARNYLIVEDTRNRKINFIVKGTDIGDTKGSRIEDLKEDLHIVLNKPETMKRLKSQKDVAKRIIRKVGRDNVIVSGHSLGGYIAADIANDLGIKAVTFNIGSSPKKLTPSFNKDIIHYTTNNVSKGILDPLSMTSSARDFYDKRRVEPKRGVGSGLIKYHTIEHFLPDEKTLTKIQKQVKLGKDTVFRLNKLSEREGIEAMLYLRLKNKEKFLSLDLNSMSDLEVKNYTRNLVAGTKDDYMSEAEKNVKIGRKLRNRVGVDVAGLISEFAGDEYNFTGKNPRGVTDIQNEKRKKYNSINKEMDFEKRRDATDIILAKTNITRGSLEKLTDDEVIKMSQNIQKGVRADTGIDKIIKGKNTGELQQMAKKLGIPNPKKYKKKNKDKNTLSELRDLIKKKTKEVTSMEDLFGEEEEMKYDKEGEPVPAGEKTRREQVTESAMATLEKIRAEKAARRITKEMSEAEKKEMIKKGTFTEGAKERIKREGEKMEEAMRKSRLKEERKTERLKPDKRIDVDTTTYRHMGASPAQQTLDRIADDRTDIQRFRDVGKYLGESGSVADLEKRLSEKGVPVDKIKEYKAVYDKVNKNITDKTLEDGSWLTESISALGVPEIKAYNEMVKLLGLDLSSKERGEVKDLINGNYKGSTGNAIKVLGQALLSPDGWGVMVGTTAEKRATRVYNDFTDIWSKDDVYKDRKQSEKDIRDVITERKKSEKTQIEDDKELARLRGEEYKGPEYKESETFNKSIGGPKLSEFGGQDDYSSWEKVGRFFLDAGVALGEEMLDPLGFIDIATGAPTPKLKKLEERLKKKNPGAYRSYKSALEKHVKTLRKASVEDRNQEMITDHKPVAKQLGDIIGATLEENSKLLQKGEEPILSRDEVQKYLNYSKKLKAGEVSYHQLAQIDYMFNSDIKGDLPQNLSDKYMQWQLEEENELSKKGAGDSSLSIAKDTEAYDDVKQIEEARRRDKEEQEEAIRDSTRAYEMIRQQEIDDENEQTLRKRKDVIHPGFVETQTNKPELRPKIVFGNTDAQFTQSDAEVREEKRLLNSMLMWKAGNVTEDNDPSSILYKRYKENEDLRYGQTYSMPKPQVKDRMIPQQFLVYNERVWVPQRADKNEQMPLLRQPERAEAVFDRFEDYRADTTSMRDQIANRRNIFPECHLQGYKGPAIKQGGLKGFNSVRNSRYLGY